MKQIYIVSTHNEKWQEAAIELAVALRVRFKDHRFQNTVKNGQMTIATDAPAKCQHERMCEFCEGFLYILNKEELEDGNPDQS